MKYARPRLAAALKDSSRGSSEGRERHRARNTLVVAQIALATVLLVASGLMIRTFLAIQNVPPGFVNPENVLTLRITIPQAVIENPMQMMRRADYRAPYVQIVFIAQKIDEAEIVIQ